MLKYMLDTKIAIYTLKDRPVKVREAFKQHTGEMCLSSISLGELIYGAEKSAQVERNLGVVQGFAARLTIEVFDAQAAMHFGQLRAELTSFGRVIRSYDMMIAGHARALGLILVTNNGREFDRVPGLRVENWA